MASDNQDDARQVQSELQRDFGNLRLSTDPARAVEGFKDFGPQVLVLAFDSLERAQHYYLGKYREGQALQQHQYRTVILCNKEEVRAAFELCKKEYFDDYVLYWPHTHDGSRLAMSIWLACRETAAPQSNALRTTDLLAHARQMGELDQIIGRILDPQSWDATFAPDGAAALALLRRARPDVVITDIRMPGLDGLSLTQQLKASPHLRDIPVVVMTGDARKET